MSQKTIRLQSYKTGTKQKLFEIEVDSVSDTFIADLQSTETINAKSLISPENNKYNYYDYSNKQMIHNLYRLERLLIKNCNYTIPHSNYSGKLTDYIDSYTPYGLDYIGATINKNGIFLLSDLTDRSGRIIDVVDTYTVDETSQPLRYVYGLKDLPANTFCYHSSADIADDFNNFKPKYNIHGIKYNYVVHIPASDRYGYYDSNTILGEYIKGKNIYDYLYSMDCQFTGTSAAVSANISSVRKYIGIDTCGDVTFLRYTDNVSYTTNTDVMNVSGVTQLSATATEDLQDTYEHIEVIQSMNRYNNQSGHKANVYSLNIQNAGLNSSTISEEAKTKIKKSILNSIRSMTKNMMPINTQLLDVYWTGE